MSRSCRSTSLGTAFGSGSLTPLRSGNILGPTTPCRKAVDVVRPSVSRKLPHWGTFFCLWWMDGWGGAGSVMSSCLWLTRRKECQCGASRDQRETTNLPPPRQVPGSTAGTAEQCRRVEIERGSVTFGGHARYARFVYRTRLLVWEAECQAIGPALLGRRSHEETCERIRENCLACLHVLYLPGLPSTVACFLQL